MDETADLAAFRAETRAWLDANCPEEMRSPGAGDDDMCWGGRKWTFRSEAQKQWLERMAAVLVRHLDAGPGAAEIWQ